MDEVGSWYEVCVVYIYVMLEGILASNLFVSWHVKKRHKSFMRLLLGSTSGLSQFASD
jgi:hypothetical protein